MQCLFITQETPIEHLLENTALMNIRLASLNFHMIMKKDLALKTRCYSEIYYRCPSIFSYLKIVLYYVYIKEYKLFNKCLLRI